MNLRALALFTSLSCFSGCTTVHVLRPDQLQRLDGYDVAQQPAKLETKTGELITFKEGDELALVRPTSAPRTGGIRSITVRSDRLVATLLGGNPFSVDLKPVTEVRLITPSPVKTVFLVVGSVLLGGAVITGLTLLGIEAFRGGLLNFSGLRW